MKMLSTRKHYRNTIKKLDKIIREWGIPSYVKKWEPLKVPDKFNSYSDFIEFLNEYVSKYHSHSFVSCTSEFSKENVKKREADDRKMPEFYFDKKNKIGRIKFWHFDALSSEGGDKACRQLTDLTKKKIKEWNNMGIRGLIIDLTKHRGGNMIPVVYGLNDILGETTLYSWNNKKTKKNDEEWKNYVNGEIVLGKFITNKLKFNKPIAVIVSEKTSSAGEFIASIFIGRDNTKLFGKNTDRTKGSFSVNQVLPLTDDCLMGMTVRLETTVDGVFHTDEYIKVDENTNEPITDAKKWILNFNK